MWKKLNQPWKEALQMAWEAYKRGTIPIGCVIVTEDGEIVSKGRNRIFDDISLNPLAGTNMAHAEMTALLGLSEKDHPNIRTYELYTTMEPCPMCFGTMVMMNIRKIRYGAIDAFAGAIKLNDELDYIKRKNIDIQQGSNEIQAFQLVLQSAYEYSRQHPRIENILNAWRETDEASIAYAKKLSEDKYFEKAAEENKEISLIYNEVIEGYISFKIMGDNHGL